MSENEDADSQALLAALDFEPACQATQHVVFGKGDAVALVTLQFPCCLARGMGYFCKGCMEFLVNNSDEGFHYSGHGFGGCGKAWSPYYTCVESIVYLRP